MLCSHALVVLRMDRAVLVPGRVALEPFGLAVAFELNPANSAGLVFRPLTSMKTECSTFGRCRSVQKIGL